MHEQRLENSHMKSQVRKKHTLNDTYVGTFEWKKGTMVIIISKHSRIWVAHAFVWIELF